MTRDRLLTSAGAALLVVTVGVASTSLIGRARLSGVPGLDALAMFPLPLLGALLVWKKPRHPIGWIMLGLGAAVATAGLTDLALRRDDATGGRAGWAQLFNHVAFATMVGSFSLLLALFPSGKPPSPRWRYLPRLSIAALVLISLSGAFGGGDDPGTPESPVAIEGAQPLFALLGGIGLVSGFIATLLGGAAVIWRARTSDATERMQIKWFAVAVGALVVLLLVSLTPLLGGSPWSDKVFDALLVLITGAVMPACIAIAILKHRLFDIDVVVNRALVYLTLTGILGAFYLLIVVALQRVLEPVTAQSDLAVAGSTLAVAALFRPARSRVQSFIDQRFYRRKYDAVRTLESFSARLRGEIDLDNLGHELVGVVTATMQPSHASVWLRGVDRQPGSPA